MLPEFLIGRPELGLLFTGNDGWVGHENTPLPEMAFDADSAIQSNKRRLRCNQIRKVRPKVPWE